MTESRAALEPALRDAVARLDPSVHEIVAYHFGWSDEHGTDTGRTSGRRRLGVLTLMCGAAGGGDWRPSMPAAVACELAFAAAVIHDDIVDHDPTRRGRPATWSVFGAARALLAGGALTGLAVEILTEQPHPCAAAAGNRLARAVVAVNTGQVLDVAFEDGLEADLGDYLRMVAGKACAFVSCGCALGAMFGGVRDIEGLAAFGEHLGLVWQLRNDLLGIWGEPNTTGKPVLSDLRARKKTYPVLAALSSTGSDRDELARLYEGEGHCLSPVDAARAATPLCVKIK